MKKRKVHNSLFDYKLPELKKALWQIFSLWKRLKASDLSGKAECFTCGREYHYKVLDCGHFMPRAFSETFFNEFNNHPQCTDCNKNLEGNREVYRVKIRDLYGQQKLDELLNAKRKFTRDRSYYLENISYYSMELFALQNIYLDEGKLRKQHNKLYTLLIQEGFYIEN